MWLSTTFAVGALLLAMLGTYGVVSHSIASRTGEIGVRMALGAATRDLRMMVFREGLIPVACGLGAGVMVAIVTGGVLRSLLYGVEPADPVIVAGVVLVIFAAAALACLPPALRATRVDPSTALRAE
jgi:ABC-type antimicrobial peptide transport system permease subunit